MPTKIGIAADHAGFELKNILTAYLNHLNIEVKDFGTHSSSSMDYPDVIHPLCNEIGKGNFNLGIIICGSGNGVNMTANKYAFIRSALCWNEDIAKLSRQHNDANILALPARYIEQSEAIKCVDAFLNTPFEGGRHQQRVNKITIC